MVNRKSSETDKEQDSTTIKRATFSGGGAKGIVYPGSYKALVESGICAQLEHISGASAGAMTATMIALGMPLKDFREVFLNLNFNDLLGERVSERSKPGVCFLTQTGAPLLELLREQIYFSLKAFFDAKKDEIFEDTLISIQKKVETREAITFANLATLHEKWPKTFKQLTVIAVRHPDGVPQIFSCEQTPEVEIALACRASASLPVILEPVEVDFKEDKVATFVDGGLFDNLPTDYFDRDEKGQYIPNSIPDQTMVFAFGEGLKDSKNQVFQAQFGSRMDEIISDELLPIILEEVFERYDDVKSRNGGLHSEKILKKAFSESLINFVELAESEEEKLLHKKIAKMVQNIVFEELGELSKKFSDDKRPQQFEAITQFLREKMTPVLYQASTIEAFKRNTLVSWLGGMQTSYKNTDQKEQGYQKLRTQYPLRTVELRVGNIKTTDFNMAQRHARVMDALGYLDTMSHIINHDLYDEQLLNQQRFFTAIVSNYEHIYAALMEGANCSVEKSELFNEIKALKTELEGKQLAEGDICREVFYLIKSYVEEKLDSPEAFALSRAVDFKNGNINASKLFKEVYEESFSRSILFSRSRISGRTIYISRALHKELANKDMFSLYHKHRYEKTQGRTRTDKVYYHLAKLEVFQEAADKTEDENRPQPTSP